MLCLLQSDGWRPRADRSSSEHRRDPRRRSGIRGRPIPRPDGLRDAEHRPSGRIRSPVNQLSSPREADLNIPSWPGDYQSRCQYYWRCITATDEQLGRILDKLDEMGVAEDTVVVFTGDNGFFLGELGLFGKRFAYEPSIRIPLVARYPRGVEPTK